MRSGKKITLGKRERGPRVSSFSCIGARKGGVEAEEREESRARVPVRCTCSSMRGARFYKHRARTVVNLECLPRARRANINKM